MTKRFKISLITATLAMAAFNSNAAVEIYNNDGITFSTDGLVNVFYSNSSIDKTDAAGVETDRTQSRVRTGFLPSNIGFNIAKQLDDVKISMRSSFWVSLSDTDNVRDESPADLGTGSLIDVRQFYATISGDFGEVLIGKDFGLYNRANILGDELGWRIQCGETVRVFHHGGRLSNQLRLCRGIPQGSFWEPRWIREDTCRHILLALGVDRGSR